jgi:hypothetical protein
LQKALKKENNPFQQVYIAVLPILYRVKKDYASENGGKPKKQRVAKVNLNALFDEKVTALIKERMVLYGEEVDVKYLSV